VREDKRAITLDTLFFSDRIGKRRYSQGRDMSLRGLSILVLFLTVMVLMLPFVLSFVLFMVLAVGIFMLLARVGLLPGFVFKTYRFQRDGEPGAGRYREKAGVEDEYSSAAVKDWYQDDQDGEVIVLPETALKKGDE
jgi:hypothetical protein